MFMHNKYCYISQTELKAHQTSHIYSVDQWLTVSAKVVLNLFKSFDSALIRKDIFFTSIQAAALLFHSSWTLFTFHMLAKRAGVDITILYCLKIVFTKHPHTEGQQQCPSIKTTSLSTQCRVRNGYYGLWTNQTHFYRSIVLYYILVFSDYFYWHNCCCSCTPRKKNIYSVIYTVEFHGISKLFQP